MRTAIVTLMAVLVTVSLGHGIGLATALEPVMTAGPTAAGPAAALPTAASEEKAPKADSSSSSRVNLNTATTDELTELPGIGETVAARIVRYRESNGSFQKIEELMNVKGIGEKTFTKLRPHVSVGETKAKKSK